MHWLALSLDAGWTKDICGYFASSLVLCTFSVKSMRLLRWLGIASNLAFISYAVIAGVPPVLMLHSLLLPINIWRLIQIECDRRRTRQSRPRLDDHTPNRSTRPLRGELDDHVTPRFTLCKRLVSHVSTQGTTFRCAPAQAALR
jgi:hypothetical protein